MRPMGILGELSVPYQSMVISNSHNFSHTFFTRFVEQDETIEFRSQANKYLKLLKTISDYFGVSDFFQKYVDFYNDVILPKIFSYLPSAAKQ